MSDRWRRVKVAGVELDVPADMARGTEQGMDGPTVTLTSPGLRLIIDHSAFADPLTGYESQRGFARRRDAIAGEAADVVSFRADDGTLVVATRLPGPMTAVVHVAPDTDPEIARRMLRSIRPLPKREA